MHEDDWLDFKGTASADGGLTNDDEANYLKALSGFANADGGVIVWGVDARRIGEDDLATGVTGVPNPERFRQQLVQLTSKLTDPPVSGVVHEIIGFTNSRGLVVTHIPAVSTGLVRGNRRGHQTFYLRAGSDFVAMQTHLIADRFARRPQAALLLEYLLVFGGTTKRGEICTSAKAILELYVRNSGMGLAEHPALQIFRDRGPKGALDANRYGGFHMSAEGSAKDKGDLVTSVPGIVIYPGSKRFVASIEYTYSSPKVEPSGISYTVFHDGPVATGVVEISSAELRSLFEAKGIAAFYNW